MTEFDPEKKHQRLGHISHERFCDDVVARAVELLPGDGELPSRWTYGSYAEFVSKYSDLGQILWAKTASYHALIIDGEYVLRIWTDTPNRCIVDIHELLTKLVGLPVSECPASVLKKSRPLTKRVVVTQLSEIEEILELIQLVW